MTATNEMLSNSEIRYNYLIDIIPDVIGELDLDGTISFVNPQIYDMLGYHPDEMIGTNFIKFIHPDDVPGIRKVMEKVIKSKEVSLPGLRLKHKKGNYILVYAKGKLIKLNDKARLIGVIREITKFNATEKKLKESEEKHRYFFDNAQIGLFWSSIIDGKFLECNDTFAKLVGYNTREECLADYIAIEHYMNLKDRDEMLEKINMNGDVKNYEMQLSKRDSTPFWASISARINLKENRIEGAATDITERKNIEIKLKESEANYRLITENANDIIAVLDDKFRLEYINETPLNKMLGYNSVDYIGKSDFLVIHPDDRKMVLNGLIKGSEVGEGIVDTRLRHKDGRYIWVESRGKTFFDRNGEKKILINIRNITERKKSEQQLRESEEKYKDLFKQCPMAILLINFEGIIEDCNSSTEVLFGYAKKELLGIDFLKFDKIPLDTKLILAKSFSKFLKTGLPEHSEIQMYRKDGKMIWINSHPINIKIDEKSYILVLIQDITERKKVEKELLLERDNFLNILNSMEDGIYIVDKNYNIEYINPFLTKEFGRYEGKKCYNYFDDREEVCPWCKNQEVFKGKTIRWEWYSAKNQKIYDLIDTPLKNVDGSVSKLEIFRDITARKKAEQKLIESEAKYRGLLETAVMGLIEIDILLNKISYINPKLLEIVGYTRDELKDKSIFYKLIHPEDLEELFKSHADRDVEFRIYSKEGKLKWLSGTRKYTISENGELIYVRLWLQDITESKEVEEIKSNLLTRFSHEFKTPLISIKGFADFLLTEYKVKLDEKILSFLRRIKDGSNRLEALINSFIESSQLEKAVIRVNLTQEDVSDLIQDVLHNLEGFIGMREHTLNVSLDEKLITTIDKEKIYIVISNILINAINYTPQGGKITIKSSIDKNFLTISVMDNGIGLTEEEKDHLFKPFGKIERYGKGWDIAIGGMGMGLYISKEIIELHGGKIWAESEGRNKGSEFHFSLPIK